MTMLERALNQIAALLAGLAALALLAMMLHVTADVAGKYFLNAPIPGTAEVVASYYMISVVFLPLAWLEVKNGPIVVELFFDMANPVLRRAMLLLGTLLSLAVYGLIAWLSWQPAVHAWEIGEIVEGAWKVVVWPTKFLLPLGLGLACLAQFTRLVLILSGRDVLPADDQPQHADPV